MKVGFVLASGIATGLVVLGPAACGADDRWMGDEDAPSDALPGVSADAPGFGSSGYPPQPPWDGNRDCPTFVIELPDAGTQADPGTLCTLAVESVDAATAAVVTLEPPTREDPSTMRSVGRVAIPPEVLARVQGTPELTITENIEGHGALTLGEWERTAEGFTFVARWMDNYSRRGEHEVVARLVLDCADAGADAGTVSVIAKNVIALCDDDGSEGGQSWLSAGEECQVCRIIAEMAPSPVVSDNRGDDLPLGRVVQLRVVELARAGNQVLLFAESDAGIGTSHEWNVSGGSLEYLDDDLVLWTLPEQAVGTTFGQLAVWNEHGAAVENFLWAVAA